MDNKYIFIIFITDCAQEMVFISLFDPCYSNFEDFLSAFYMDPVILNGRYDILRPVNQSGLIMKMED